MKTALLLMAALTLVACSEKPQQVGGRDRTPAWDGAQDPFVVSGWKAGDRQSWEQQLGARALNQNEYRRIGTTR
jgi:hypothetical protein